MTSGLRGRAQRVVLCAAVAAAGTAAGTVPLAGPAQASVPSTVLFTVSSVEAAGVPAGDMSLFGGSSHRITVHGTDLQRITEVDYDTDDDASSILLQDDIGSSSSTAAPVVSDDGTTLTFTNPDLSLGQASAIASSPFNGIQMFIRFEGPTYEGPYYVESGSHELDALIPAVTSVTIHDANGAPSPTSASEGGDHVTLRGQLLDDPAIYAFNQVNTPATTMGSNQDLYDIVHQPDGSVTARLYTDRGAQYPDSAAPLPLFIQVKSASPQWNSDIRSHSVSSGGNFTAEAPTVTGMDCHQGNNGQCVFFPEDHGVVITVTGRHLSNLGDPNNSYQNFIRLEANGHQIDASLRVTHVGDGTPGDPDLADFTLDDLGRLQANGQPVTPSIELKDVDQTGYVLDGAIEGGPYSIAIASHLTAPVVASPGTASTPVGQPYSIDIPVSGSPAPAVAVYGLPAGLTSSPSADGVLISGTPSTAGTAYITIKATNSVGKGSGKLALSVLATPVFNGGSTDVKLAPGTSLTDIITASGGATMTVSGAPSWMVATAKPGSVKLNGRSPKPAYATAVVTVTATNSAGSVSEQVTVHM
ncbi:hypothetical protein EV189_1300 [Motilibacter rhizosphaerae]|uniref:Uncharacterized protein n=1 Tax=Motilibacter rhizosphaerae TaxID=598652 RepID=A0A4Q7NR43_9ACTN|nr:Ig domain-containing protein [Motilibacter rhizosphaerae]RZS89533.1 hypothetical protein EV189_1300 [Motilibacter rhizosphaerae]